MRVIGIDPGSQKMGIAVVEGDGRQMRAVAWKTVRLRQQTMVLRLQGIYTTCTEWLETYQPDVAAVEDVFVRNNARSALILGQARGAAMLAVGTAGLEPSGYAPATVKKAVAGHGRAGKSEMAMMVRMQLGLDRTPPEDASDALAVAMTHLFERDMRLRSEQVQ